MTLTPWTATTGGMLNTLTKHKISCQPGSVLNGFVLEAKDRDPEEVRFDYGCCRLAPVLPISVVTEQTSISGSFSDYEGVYYPRARVNGRIEMVAGFLFNNTSAAATSLSSYKV